MFYNQNFDNSYDFDSRKNNFEKEEKHECKKGYCTVKVIQECCYPSYFDYEDKKDDKHNECNKHEDKKDFKEEICDCKKENKEEYDCGCRKEDKWEDKTSCQNNYNNRCCCKQRNSVCGICSCFRRW